MHEHGREQTLDVDGNHVFATLEQGPGARCTLQGERAAHGAADRDCLEAAGSSDEVDDPAPKELVDVHVLRGGLEADDVVDGDHRLEVLERMAEALLLEDP